MKKITNFINMILIKLFNKAIFSEFSVDRLNEKTKTFQNQKMYYYSYHKNFDKNDWRFSTNNKRKNVKYIKLKLLKFKIL
jgi:hypothetical protein